MIINPGARPSCKKSFSLTNTKYQLPVSYTHLVAIRLKPALALAVEDQVRLFRAGEAQGEFPPVFVLLVLGKFADHAACLLYTSRCV